MACKACNSTAMTIQNPRIMVHYLPLAKPVDLGNTPLNIIRRMRMVSLLHSSHFLVLHSVITFSIQHDTQHSATNYQRKPIICKLSATVAKIWPPPGQLGWVSNVSPAAVSRTRAVISTCTKSASRTTGKQCSHFANIFQLYSSTRTSFWCTWETSHQPLIIVIPAACGTAENWCRKDWGRASIAGAVLWQIKCRWWERQFVGLGWCRGQTPSQPEANQILRKAICQWMGRPTYSVFNKCKKVWVAGFPETKHQSIIRGRNPLKQLRDGPLDWEIAVADCLERFESWLPWDNFNNAEWICMQWVEMVLKK